MATEHIDTLVIGAGHAGLGVSRELVRRGVDHLVLDQGRVGESWRSLRWEAFRLNTPAWMNRLPGDAAPARPDAFPSAPEFADGLARYAFAQRLPIRDGVTVLAVERAETGGSFSVLTSDGAFAARSVVLATGAARVPRIPASAAELPGSVLQLHTAAYRNADELPPGAALVVGGGQSGLQVAEDLLLAGRDVHLATSPVGRLPRRYRGRDSFAWLVEAGFFDERTAGGRPAPSPQISGVGGGHTLSYQHLRRLGATLLGGVAGVSGSQILLRADLAANVAFADGASAGLRARIDAHIERVGAEAPRPEPDPADAPMSMRLVRRAPRELDLRRASVGCVIWATGFDADSAFVRLPVVGERGRIVQRDGATAVPGLFVAGPPWLRTRGSGTIYGAAADAPHVADLVARRLTGGRRLAA